MSSTERRSGTSFTQSTRDHPDGERATSVAARNAGLIAAASAPRSAGGRRWIGTPSPAVVAADGRPWFTITPITVTPIVAPICRENVAERRGRADARARDGVLDRDHEHLHHRADPDARRSTMLRAAWPVVVCTFIRQSSAIPSGEHERADQHVPAVAAGARDQLAREDRRGHGAEHQRRQHDAGRGRGRADHALHEERHVDDRAEHRHPDERHARDAAGDDRVAQQLERAGSAPSSGARRARTRAARRRRRSNAPSDVAARPGVVAPAPDERRAGAPRCRPASSPAPSQSIECSARTARRGIVSEITTSASAADREVDEEDPAPASCCRR